MRGDASRPAPIVAASAKRPRKGVKPSTYAYRRKQGCGDKEREVQNTYRAVRMHAEIVFLRRPADPTLSEAGHQSLVPGEEKKHVRPASLSHSGFNLAWLLRSTFLGHCGAPSLSLSMCAIAETVLEKDCTKLHISKPSLRVGRAGRSKKAKVSGDAVAKLAWRDFF